MRQVDFGFLIRYSDVRKSVDNPRAAWVRCAKVVRAIQRTLPEVVAIEVNKRVVKRVDKFGNVYDFKVDDRIFKSSGEASHYAAQSISNDLIAQVEAILKRMRSLVIDEDVTPEMVAEADEPDEKLERELVAAQESLTPMGAALSGAPTKVDDQRKPGPMIPTDPGFKPLDAERAKAKIDAARKSRTKLF